MRIAHTGCAFVLVLMATPAFAQTLERGEIQGTVYDPNHAVVARAQVTLASGATGFERKTETDDSGAYRFPQVPAGEYQITAESAGTSVSTPLGTAGEFARDSIKSLISISPALLRNRPQTEGAVWQTASFCL